MSGTRVQGAVVLVAALASCGAAVAAPVKFPADKPRVVLDVPADWSKDVTPNGLELRSPEKNSVVIVQIVGRDKGQIEAWAHNAGARLKALGVAFDSKAKPPPLVAMSGVNTSGLSDSAGAPSFTGPPTLATPGTSTTGGPLLSFGQKSLDPFERMAPASPKADGKMKMRTIEYVGTTVNGKKVDADLAIYSLSSTQDVVLMQESDPEDNRSVAIARSVRPIK